MWKMTQSMHIKITVEFPQRGRHRCELHPLATRWHHWYKYALWGLVSSEKRHSAYCIWAPPAHKPHRPEAKSSPLISNPFAWSSAAARSLKSELQETSLTSSEMRSCPPHSAPVNLAKENSGRFFTSPHVTLMVLLSAGGKLQVSHCVKGNDSQDGGFPHVTGACSGSSVCLGELQQPSELMCGNSHWGL